MTIEVMDTDKRSPQQTLLKSMDFVEEMDHVIVAYVPKGKDHIVMYCSTMKPVDMNFIGFALQNHSLSFMED